MEKIYIVTPCYRQQNLDSIFKSIDFSIIYRWFIVYDTTKDRKYNKIYKSHPQIVELECSDYGKFGHAQRNFAISLIDDGFIYFCDDDNIICKDLYEFLGGLDKRFYYTWDQLRNKNGDDTEWALFHNEKGKVLKGNVLRVQFIDTAQIIFPKNLLGSLRWKDDDYKADGIFIESLNRQLPDAHIYIPKVLCYYNYLE